MKTVVIALALTLATGNAYAASCAADATDKKLAGAAKTSFMTKCEKERRRHATRRPLTRSSRERQRPASQRNA